MYCVVKKKQSSVNDVLAYFTSKPILIILCPIQIF